MIPDQEKASKKQQESIVDLELDYLAPYLERYPDVESITKAQALEVSAHLQEAPIGLDPKNQLIRDRLRGCDSVY